MKKLPPLKRIQSLTTDQRDQIIAWLDLGKSYRWIIQQTAKPLDQGGFGEPVPKTCLFRFNKRRLALQSGTLKKSFGDLSQIAKDINHYAASGDCGSGTSGQPGSGFHQATVQLIEQEAFQLALTHREHDKLKDLFRMKLQHDLAQARVKHVEIQDGRLQLAEQKFQHQKSIDEKKYQEPEQPKQLTPEEQQERFWDVFHIPEEERVRRRAKSKARAEAEAKSAEANGESNSTSGQSGSEHKLTPNPNTCTDSHQGDPLNPDLNLTPNPNTCTDIAHSDSSHFKQEPTPPPSLETMTKNSEAYTVLRAHEYWAHRRLEDAYYEEQGRHPYKRGTPPEYQTQLRECPCGSQLPCPHHEEFNERFWKVGPHECFYARSLRDRGIPYREPTEFLV